MQLTFLGTGSMIPTIERNHTSMLLSYKNENILIDCGEGTQKQLRLAKISPAKITRILITHWHGDHILGLPGLLQTLQANEYRKILYIYGPINSKEYLNSLLSGFISNLIINIKLKEITSSIVEETREFQIKSSQLTHNCPCLGYSFIEKDKRNIDIDYLKKFNLTKHPILKQLQQGKDIEWKGIKIEVDKATKIKKGRKITFILDTAPTDNAVELAKDSDILVAESTHLDELKEKSNKYKHLTSKQSALIAKKAKVKKLILTHFSQRYKETSKLLKEAKSIFKNTIAAKDLMKIEI